MTNEELDALASGYLDGEATPEEVALVERDPTLMARVHELRQVQALLRAPVRPSQELKDRQLSAALEEFGRDRRASLSVVESDQSTGDTSINLTGDDPVPVVPDPVPDPILVGAGAEAPAADAGSNVIDLRSRQSQRRPDNRMRWLSAAAGFLVFGFGAVFLAGQMNSADDGADEAAVAALDESADATEEGESFEDAADDGAAAGAAIAADSADEAAAMESDAAMESEEMSADAEEPLAVTDSADDTAGAEEEAAEESADSRGGPPIIFDDVPDSGFFPNEPAVGYANVPSSDEIVGNLDLRWRQPESAQCAARVSLPADAEVIGHLPIEVTNPDGTTAVVEALYVVSGPDFEVILVDPDTCALF